MASANQLEAAAFAWRNSCMEKLGAEEGKRIAAVLGSVLRPGANDEELLDSARFALQSEGLGFATSQELMRNLSRDFYAAIAHESALESLGEGSAFESMDSLLSALESSASQLDAVLAGKAEAPDVTSLLSLKPEVVEAEAVRLGAAPEEAERLVGNLWRRIAELMDRAQVDRSLQQVKLAAIVQLLEESRLAGAWNN